MFGGIVVRGDGIGRTYGYPTANINCSKKNVDIQPGVYACYAFVHKKKYPAALAIQQKPWKLEVHLFDFDEDLYGIYMEVEPIQKVGEYQSVSNTKELIEKIQNDIKMVKDLLGVL